MKTPEIIIQVTRIAPETRLIEDDDLGSILIVENEENLSNHEKPRAIAIQDVKDQGITFQSKASINKAVNFQRAIVSHILFISDEQCILVDLVKFRKKKIFLDNDENIKDLVHGVAWFLKTGNPSLLELIFNKDNEKMKKSIVFAFNKFKEKIIVSNTKDKNKDITLVEIFIQVLVFLRILFLGLLDEMLIKSVEKERRKSEFIPGKTSIEETLFLIDVFLLENQVLHRDVKKNAAFHAIREMMEKIVFIDDEQKEILGNNRKILQMLISDMISISNIDHELTGAIIGNIFEATKKSAAKRKSGAYFTPIHWVYFSCQKALNYLRENKAWNDNEVSNISILDPAMGSGDFIETMLELMTERALRSNKDITGIDLNTKRFHEKLQIIHSKRIVGIDIDEVAVKIARCRMFISILEHVSLSSGLKEDLAWSQIVPEIMQGDYLLMSFKGREFDIIIGNPPYLMEVRKNQDIFRKYSHHPMTRQYYEPKMDIFYFFMFKGIEMLKRGGILSYYVQEYWLNRYHAKQLRKTVFLESCPIELILFKSFKVFPKAPGHHSMLAFIRNEIPSKDTSVKLSVIDIQKEEKRDNDVLISLLKDHGKCNEYNDDKSSIIKFSIVPVNMFYDPRHDKVFINGSAERDLFYNVLKNKHFKLLPNEVQIGINIPQPFLRKNGKSTGIFVLTRDEIRQMNLNDDELRILRPFHQAADLGPFRFRLNHEMFIIYSDNEIKREIKENPGKYPNIWRHLSSNAKNITSDHGPFGLHRPRQPTWFESQSKIIGVRKTRSPKFVLVPVDYYMDQSAIFIKLNPDRGISPYYTCAFLNTNVAFSIFKGFKTQGNQLQIDKSILLKVPIPILPSPYLELVDLFSRIIHVCSLLISMKDNNALVLKKLENYSKRLIDDAFNVVFNKQDIQVWLGNSLIEPFNKNKNDEMFIDMNELLVSTKISDDLVDFYRISVNVKQARKFINNMVKSLGLEAEFSC
ncbi:MAG: Eco57I restriction-modification methylase domain-containing protein [Promethearchaeota archaeon]